MAALKSKPREATASATALTGEVCPDAGQSIEELEELRQSASPYEGRGLAWPLAAPKGLTPRKGLPER